MSFTWPTIPFQGPEVTAFAAAYKELAEEVLSYYFNSPIGHLADVTSPYREKLVMKELLQEGLVYACFIIQQRSGATGPGTDFVLGNSPLDLSDPNIEPAVLRLLGCKWSEMEESYQNNIKCGNLPPEQPLVEDNRCCEEGASFAEGASINSINTFMFGNPWRDMLSLLLNKYLDCESSPLTANDLNSNDLVKIKDDLQRMITDRDKFWGDIGWNANNSKKVEDTTGDYTAAQLTYWGATKVYRVSTYTRAFTPPSHWGGHYVVGYTTVTTDGNDNVLCMKDDFDFAYGWEMDRSDGSLPGDPYSGRKPGEKTVDANGNPKSYEQVMDAHGSWHGLSRNLPINAFYGCNGGGHSGGGRGTPIPINVCF